MPRIPASIALAAGLSSNAPSRIIGVAAPVSPSEPPPALRPYVHHKVDLDWHNLVHGHATATCPFCGKEGKFSVAPESGLWRCWSCGAGTERGGGNAMTFLRLLWERSDEKTTNATKELAAERGFLDPFTLTRWGAVQSIIDKTWMIPGYGVSGQLDQLYRRTKMPNKLKTKWTWTLLPTPGLWPEGRMHRFHRAEYDENKEQLWIFEGPWDAMAAWEILKCIRKTADGYEFTGNELASLLASVNVIAVPGCNSFHIDWAALAKDKHVTLWFDGDPPRQRGNNISRPGWDGMRRVSSILASVASSLKFVRWGPDGYDPISNEKIDVRDVLKGGPTYQDRVSLFGGLMGLVEPVPEEWIDGSSRVINGHIVREIEPLECNDWETVEQAWKEAMQWRQTMSDVLACMLAVAGSTLQAGNQLFLQVIGDAGSGKTQMCDGLVVSRHCHSLEHLTGFHSGFKKPGDNDADCSLIARINGKTLVTPEGDVLMSSPKFQEIMSQIRRIFDGTSGATYKNSDEDKRWVGLRTPWIMAGTQALMDTDQSRLGDRFMRIIIDPPTETEKRLILRRALESELAAVVETSDGSSGSTLDPKMRRAQALTGGYVNWLRANAAVEIGKIKVDEWARSLCISLAELTADLRARPNSDAKKLETHDSKELPTRITRQLVRFATCLAVVLNRSTTDRDVMRRVRKVAIDTAHGHSLNVVRRLLSKNVTTGQLWQETGFNIEQMKQVLGMPDDRTQRYLVFLQRIKVLERIPIPHTLGFWKLTDRVVELYNAIYGA